RSLLITADGGGSNGSRVRLWKIELQRLADELKVPITVCHLPPGTSKWNKIEHRLFSFITMNRRGKPLRSYRTVVQLIAATSTDTGLKVRAELDERKYPKGLKVSDTQLAAVNIYRHSFNVTGTTRSPRIERAILLAQPLLHGRGQPRMHQRPLTGRRRNIITFDHFRSFATLLLQFERR